MTDALPARSPTMKALADSIQALIATVPDLMHFAGLPAALGPGDAHATDLPASAHLFADPGRSVPATADAVANVLAAIPFANWQQTYSEAQVGADFLARYGWFELWGPTGHFHCASARAYIAFWGAHLTYADHWHEAEEIYYILAGSAAFSARGMATATVGPGQTRQHLSNQPHAMITTDEPVLALVLWRGTGLDGVPYMPDEAITGQIPAEGADVLINV